MNFCLLSWGTSEVAVPEPLAPETTASAPGGVPASRGHGPDLRTGALSFPDALGASSGRHHLILVPGKTNDHLPPVRIPTLGCSQANPASSPGPDPVGSSHPRLPPLSLFFLSARLALQDSNIQACLPLTFTPEEYEKQDIQ